MDSEPAEKSVTEAEPWASAVLDAVPALVVLVDGAGRIRRANRPHDPGLAKLAGRLPAGADFDDTCAGLGTWQGRVLVGDDGRRFETVARDLAPGGRVVSFVDVSARESALAASAATSRFLATLSHEIRTPLNGILGMTNLILASGLGAEQRENALLVRQSG